MKKTISILAFCIFYFLQTSAQPEFIVDTLLFPGKKFQKITSTKEGDIWLLSKEFPQKIYRLKTDLTWEDKTADLGEAINHDITDIVALEKNKLLIGTARNYAYLWDDDRLRSLKDTIGFEEDEAYINSLLYNNNRVEQDGTIYNETYRMGISTNGNSYGASSWNSGFTNLNLRDVDSNAVFLSNENPYFYKWEKDSLTYIIYQNSSGIFDLREFKLNEYGKVLSGEVRDIYNNGNAFLFFIGTENGLIIKRDGRFGHFFQGSAVYSILNYDRYNTLIGTEHGLFLKTKFNYDLIPDLVFADIEVYDMYSYNGCLYVCSNQGLLRYKNSDCSSFNAGFDQNTQYLNLALNEELQLTDHCTSCADLWSYDFGDGETVTEASPVKLYDSVGNFRITLLASNGYCTDTAYSLISTYRDSSGLQNTFRDYLAEPFHDSTNNKGNIALGDINNDDKLDLYIPGKGLFIQNEIPDSILFSLLMGVDEMNISQPMIVDLDNDGYNDIVTWSGYYRNNGGRSFEFKEFNGDNLENSPRNSMLLLDYDLNGYLDIFSWYGGGTYLMKNMGDFHFEFIKGPTSYGDPSITQILWMDTDFDDESELVLIRVNNGHPIYKITEQGFILQGEFLPDVSAQIVNYGDINNDRLFDLVIASSNSIFLNSGNSWMPYTDSRITNDFEPYRESYYATSAAAMADIDNNSLLDYIKLHRDAVNRLYLNMGNLAFINNRESLFTQYKVSHLGKVLPADIDNNGSIDLLVGNGDGSNSHIPSADFLLINEDPAKNWIKFILHGTASNANAIGAIVQLNNHVHNKSIWQSRRLDVSNAGLGQNGFEIHFGMDTANRADTTRIIWPSGHLSEIIGLEANKTYHIVEPYINLLGDTTSCMNQLPSFNMPVYESLSYTWLRNDSLMNPQPPAKWIVTQSGRYSCLINNNNISTDTSATIDIVIHPIPEADIYFEERGEFCDGDSVKAMTNAAGIIHKNWITNGFFSALDTLDYLYVSDSSSIYLQMMNEYNCQNISNILHASKWELPMIDLPDQTGLCTGDSLMLGNIIPSYTYHWNTGDTVGVIKVVVPATYRVHVKDSNLCENRYSVKVIDYPMPPAELGSDIFIGLEECSNLIPKSYNYKNSYIWNSSFNSASLMVCGEDYGLGSKHFYVDVTALNGCTNTDSINVYIILKDTFDEPVNDLVPYPNPSRGRFMLYYGPEFSETPATLRIYNSSGVLLYEREVVPEFPYPIEINMGNQIQGLFLINLENKDVKRYKKLLILSD